MSDKTQREGRINESERTRTGGPTRMGPTCIGPEELDVKRRSDGLMPEGMEAEELAKLPLMIRSLIRDGMCLKSLGLRLQHPPRKPR